MANSSAKKLLKANNARLKNLTIAIGAVNIVFLAIRFLLFRSSPLTTVHKVFLAIFTLLYAAPFYLIWSAARPAYDAHGALISAGDDISKPGLLEYAHDVIYLTIAVHFLFSFTRFAPLIFLTVPLYFIYSWATAPKDDDDDAVADESMDDASGPMSRKERRKAERSSRKQK